MAGKDEVLDLVRSGLDYEQIGARLGIPPGRAYLIATGLPADGSHALTDADRRRPGFVEGSTQHLVNHGPVNPTRREDVLAWVRRRAAADLGGGA